MARNREHTARLRAGIVGALLATACGLFLLGREGDTAWFSVKPAAGHGLAMASYDRSFVWLSPARFDDISLVLLDRDSFIESDRKWGGKEAFDRSRHAELLEQLRRDGCRMVVFDMHFERSGATNADPALAAAMRAHGRVVLAAVLEERKEPGRDGNLGRTVWEVVPLHPLFAEAARTNWGIARVSLDVDGVARRHYEGRPPDPALHQAAAAMAGVGVATNGAALPRERWVRYYGPAGSFENQFRYKDVLGQLPDFFTNKIVFIGGLPDPGFPGENKEEFATPFTLHGDRLMPGVEIVATMFQNLRRGDWLERLPTWGERAVLLVCGALFGFGLPWLKPWHAIGVALGGFVLLALIGLGLARWTDYWFPWLLVSAGQIPCAWAWSVLAHTQRLAREKALLEKKVARAEPAPVAGPAKTPAQDGLPAIPDHTLLRRIGKGAYGEVWIARNAVGLYHAVKIVFQKEFRSAEPYDREFGGIRRFMPVSHEHPGLVRVLHVGRNDDAAYFYYMMELGDGQAGGQSFDPVTYAAKTLESERRRRGHFTVGDCVGLGLHLGEALEFLHVHKLVHRDIKPHNIIYVKGTAKFADIGLVTDLRETDESRTYIGTPGYIAPEGPGTATADVYSLGKVLYVLCTGHDAGRFPELPGDLSAHANVPALFRLNEIILKACDHNERRRYASAAELHADLLRLRDLLARGPA